MHPLIEQNLKSITELCRAHGVKRLEAFGSILREDFNAAKSTSSSSSLIIRPPRASRIS